MTVVYLDCETTGLDPTRNEIWELAIIKDGTEWEFHLPVDLSVADPIALRVGRFYERRSALSGLPNVAGVRRWRARRKGADEQKWVTDTTHAMAEIVAGLLDGAHIVGAVPSFDASFLTPWLRRNGHCGTWNYHLIDVEALAAGYLVGGSIVDWSGISIPPWDSNELSRAIGVDPEDFDRHTALGDAKWAKAIYDRIMGQP